MPSRAARWISAIALRSKRSTRAGPGASRYAISTRVVDVEVVEPPRRAVAPELGRVDVVDPGPLEQLARARRRVLVAHLLLDAVGAEPCDRAAHVEARLVDRVAERVAGVAAARPASRVCAMNALMCPTEPRTTMSTPFIEMPQRAEASPWTTSSPPRPVAPGRLARVAVDDDRARHHVLGDAGAGVAVHAHGRALVHAGAVVAHVALDLDLDRARRARTRPRARRSG